MVPYMCWTMIKRLRLDIRGYSYVNEEREVGVIEYNVDTIKDSQIILDRDGQLKRLKEKKDYKVTGTRPRHAGKKIIMSLVREILVWRGIIR